MAHNDHKAPGKRISFLILVVALLVTLAAVSGGVMAYLSHISDPNTNQVITEHHPVITVNADHSITLEDPGYGVFLRAVVVVNWQTAEGNILAATPEGVTLTPGTNWFLHTDGFYYYRSVVTDNRTTAPVVSVSNTPSMEDCTMQITVVAQTVQAVGQTDGDDPVDAVYDAWGITAAEITGS